MGSVCTIGFVGLVSGGRRFGREQVVVLDAISLCRHWLPTVFARGFHSRMAERYAHQSGEHINAALDAWQSCMKLA